jgi:hypothetical protein
MKFLVGSVLFAGLAMACQPVGANPVVNPPSGGFIPGQAGCRFIAENVEMTISDTSLTVDGSYTFRRRYPHSGEALRFPFLEDPTMGKPALVRATVSYDHGPAVPFEVSQAIEGWTWFIRFGNSETCTVRVVYRQSLKTGRAGYLLTSCRAWGQPLEEARLVVRFLVPVENPVFTLPLKPVAGTAGQPIYVGHYRKWLPKEDLVVTWSQNQARG